MLLRNQSTLSLLLIIIVTIIISYKTDATYLKNNVNSLQNLTRIRRQSDKCQGFQCKTTPECIDEDKQCDGVEDCRDGSDEYEAICKDFPCYGYLFKCDYGGCISLTQKCNREKNCKDGSDEANCPYLIEDRINTNCRSDQFECGNGDCVSVDGRCDGVADCKDETDESKDVCFNIYCPGYTYKCAYGACVDGDARCNGVKNCLDNSDEENCGPVTLPTPKPTEPSTVTTRPATGGCVTPKQPELGQWVFTYNNRKGGKGERVAASTVLLFTCNKGYKLSSTERDEEYVFCTDKGWTFTKMPTCEKLCPPYYSTTTTTLKCKSIITGSEVACDKATNGTQLSVTCAPYYEIPIGIRRVRYCTDGTWDYSKPECTQVCGEKRVTAKPLIVNGVEVERGNYPWVAAIYARKANTNEYTNICGGSMIAQNIILTAAHCVTNDKGVPHDPKNYQVAVGKYYNKYKDPADADTAQYSQVQEILVADQYKGDILHYLGDIALLIMKQNFALSKVVQPVCYDGIKYDINIGYGSKGIVNGWGYTRAQGDPSNVLKELEIPYKDKALCISEFPPDWADKYVTYDKMCGGYLNKNTSVCKGDSGGGLVFKDPTRNRYYIQGIVSVAHSIDKFTCDVQKSALFTMVKEHYDWMDQKIAIKARRS